MSIILQALKKADAARDIGSVPTLKAHAAQGLGDDHDADTSRARWPLLVLLLGVLALGAAVGIWASRSGGSSSSGNVNLATSAVVASGSVGGTASGSASGSVEPTKPAVVVPATPLPIAQPAPTIVLPTVPAVVTAKVMPASTPAPASAPATKVSAATAVAPAPLLEELSAEQRRGLPAITVNGSIYADKAADRILIINGQVLHEGDLVAPDLTLITVGSKAAVLRFGQLRFTVRY